MTNNEILESINNIDSVVLESELNVIKSLIDSYSKSLMILENYQGDNLDSFEIFSESFIMEADDNTSNSIPKKKESIIKKILLAIPRLFMWLAKKIKSIWKNRPAARMERELKEMKSAYNKLSKETRNQILDLNNDIEYHENRINGMRSNLKTINNGMEIKTKYNKILNEKIDNLAKTVESNKKDADESIASNKQDVINTINRRKIDIENAIHDLYDQCKYLTNKVMEKQSLVNGRKFPIAKIKLNECVIMSDIDFDMYYDRFNKVNAFFNAVQKWFIDDKMVGSPFTQNELIEIDRFAEWGNADDPLFFQKNMAYSYDDFSKKADIAFNQHETMYKNLAKWYGLIDSKLNEIIKDGNIPNYSDSDIKNIDILCHNLSKLSHYEYQLQCNLRKEIECAEKTFKAYKDAFNKLK